MGGIDGGIGGFKGGKGNFLNNGIQKCAGKGCQGTCYACGRVGYKAVECQNRAANCVEEDVLRVRSKKLFWI